MKPAFVAFSCLLIMTLSCKKPKDEGEICFTRTLSELKIENHTGKEFHFAAFGRNILPTTDWIPICTAENEIPANGTVNRDLSAIFGYSDSDLVAVFWWKCTGNNPGEMQYVDLDKLQTVCK